MIANGFIDPRNALSSLWSGYIILVHATAFLAGIALLQLLLRPSQPDLRARLHAASAVGALGVSLLCWAPSDWWAHVVPGAVAGPLLHIGAASIAAEEAPGTRNLSLLAGLYVVWIAGASFILLRTAVGWLRIAAISRRAEQVHDAIWSRSLRDACTTMDTGQHVELRLTSEVATPLACGILNPVILLPAEAASWPADTQRMVLLHELAHVRRNDILVQLLVQLASAWYWFHPAMWWAAKGLRDAREEACDALVLASGVRKSDYAACLMNLSRRAGGCEAWVASTAAAGMVRPHRLTKRIRQVIEARKGPGLPPWVPALVTAACLGWALVLGTVRFAMQREVLFAALASDDWARRSYAAYVLSASNSIEVRERMRAQMATDPHPVVQRIVSTSP